MKIVKLFIFGISISSIIFMGSCSSKEEPTYEKVDTMKIRASNYFKGYKPSKFVDDKMSTFWHSDEPPGNFDWVSISYEKLFKVSKYTIARRSDISSQAPVEFILEGASTPEFPDSDTKWETIDKQENQIWDDNIKTYTIKLPKDFIHYRLRIIQTGDGMFASIAEWKLEK